MASQLGRIGGWEVSACIHLGAIEKEERKGCVDGECEEGKFGGARSVEAVVKKFTADASDCRRVVAQTEKEGTISDIGPTHGFYVETNASETLPFTIIAAISETMDGKSLITSLHGNARNFV